MFGRQSGLNTTGSSSNLVEFKAGRMNMIGKMVHPDARKGMVYMMQSEDGLMHFCWKDRGTGRVEDDLIVFPDDFEFKRVEQCKTGRVYVLKFKTSTRRMFFWMQEPKTDKDDEHCRRVNDLLNNPPSASRGGGGGGSDNNDLQYMLNNMSQQQLMQLFGGVGQMGGLSSLLGSMNRNSDSSRTPSSNRSGGFSSTLLTPENSSTTVPRTPSAPKGKTSRTNSSSNGGSSNNGGGGGSSSDNGGKKSSSNPFDSTSEFQSYLSNLSPEAGASRSLNIDLSTAIAGSDAVNQLITDPEASKLLSVHLPELDDNDETRKQQIKEHIQSPQFQQALTMFTTALQSAQLGPVVSQFELPADAISAAYSGNLEDFVKALEKALPEGATMQVDPPQEAAATGTAATETPPAASKDKETAVKPESEVSKSEDKKTEKTED